MILTFIIFILQGLQWDILLIYLDDIVIMAPTMEENLSQLEVVLGKLRDAGLKLKPSKCQILQSQVLFLGHIISALSVQPNPRLIESVREWRVPSDRREVQQFLGLANYYRRFISNFSDLAAPLTELTSKSVVFGWSSEAQSSFEELKNAL